MHEGDQDDSLLGYSSSTTASSCSVAPAPSADGELKLSCSSVGSGGSILEPASVFPHLRASRPSDLARKRVVHRNPPPLGKCRSHGCGANESKSMTPRRVNEHPGEFLTVSNKRLFCRACREKLSLVSRVISNHLKATKQRARS